MRAGQGSRSGLVRAMLSFGARGALALLGLSVVLGSAVAEAAPPGDSGGSPAAAGGGGASGASSCTPSLPEGAAAPTLRVELPEQGKSGTVLPMVLVVTHGRGETVFPQGIHLDASAAAAEGLKKAGFIVPDPSGPAAPSMTSTDRDGQTETRVVLPLVPLPPEPGRQELTVPALPVEVARASGELITLCTDARTVTVEDPTANTPNAAPMPNPAGRRQLEVWREAQRLALIAALVAAALVVALFLWLWWRRRPRPARPAPPPRPPWETALEELTRIRAAHYVEKGETERYVEEVCNTVRRYLGERYRGAFRGLGQASALESTTAELLGALKSVSPRVPALDEIEALLAEADLVKFARRVPDASDCARTDALGEQTILRTRPAAPLGAPPGAPPPASTRARSGEP